MKNLIVCALMMTVISCGDDAKQDGPQKDTGRPETQKLKAVDAVGYDGDALRGTVDKMLDKRDKQQQELDDAQQAAGASEDKKE